MFPYHLEVAKPTGEYLYLALVAYAIEYQKVEAMLDKTLSALSGVFIRAPGSTFTEDILRLRRGWGTVASVEAMLDKTLSALSGVFIGAPGSTFIEDILRLRR
nr:O-fucosyltransferase 36-like [Tanacetum cinerariifolium]